MGDMQKKTAVDKILADWTKAGADDDGPVSLRRVLERHGSSRTQTFEHEQLERVLSDLGCGATSEARVRDAWSKLSAVAVPNTAEGELAPTTISFADFGKWWHSDSVTYTLKRDEDVPAGTLDDPMHGNSVRSDINVVVERTTKRSIEVAGLKPNSAYRFTLQLTTSRSHSCDSLPVQVITAPSKPEGPFVIYREPKAVVLKWYPGEGGAHKYILQSKFIDTLDAQARGAPARAHGQADDSWKIVYEGRENTVKVTGLFANSVYRFRVRAVNVADSASVLSDLAQVSTMSSWTGLALQPKNAHEVFTVDCTDDIVAARVLKDAYRSAGMASRGASRRRDLRLEVIWSTVSTKEAVAHILNKETLIEREQARIFLYECCRCLWVEENRRLGARAELYSLQGMRV